MTEAAVSGQIAMDVAAEALGGVGRADPALCAVMAIDVLGKVVGGDLGHSELGLSSLSIDVAGGKLAPGQPVSVRAEIDKKTRAIVFATVEAHTGCELVFSARGLFSPRV